VLACLPALISIWVLAKQQHIKSAMKHKLEVSILKTIHIKKDDLVWVKKGKEIKLNGKMFDIKSITKTQKGNYIVTGLYDEQEDELFANIDNMIRRDKKSTPFTTSSVEWVHQLLFTHQHCFDYKIATATTDTNFNFASVLFVIPSPYLTVPPVPPWFSYVNV
jgi:hypothetical protein